MQLPDRAPLAFWPSRLAVQTVGRASEPHAHHALHLVLARRGALRVRFEGGADREAPGVLTAPDVPHAIDGRGLPVTLLFLDPESEDGASARATFDGPVRWLGDAERDALLDGLPADAGSRQLATWMDDALDRLLPARERPALDPRVKRVTERLRRDPAADVSLEALAVGAGLSPSHFLHVFKASMGIPLRPYVRWLRVQRAAAHIVRGVALSEAALEAGFSDAAHLSRTFRATFGMSPSDLRPPRP